MSKYSELLKDFNWQAVRAKVIIRDGNKCTVCGSKKKLNVHHTFYYSDNRPPWLYPLSSLLTVCEPCHLDYHIYHEIEIRKPKPIKINGKVKKKEPVFYDFRCECISGKKIVFRIVRAANKYDAIVRMVKRGLPVIEAKIIRKPK